MCDFIYCTLDSIAKLLSSQTFWTAIGAIGTIVVSWLALFPKKDKEIIDCWYWDMGAYLRVNVENKSNVNCILEKDSYLIITMGDSGELKTKPLRMKEFIPAHSRCNIHYAIDEEVRNVLKADIRVSIFLFTQRGTVVRLKKGFTSEPISFSLDETT